MKILNYEIMANINYISTYFSGFGLTVKEAADAMRGLHGLPFCDVPLTHYEHKPIEHPHIHPDGAIQKQANGIWNTDFYDNGFNVIKK